MLKFKSANAKQYDVFLQLIWDDGQEYWADTMRIMQLTWEEYAQIFRTRGEVSAIYQGENLAGFYWIEERVDTLHLHGLILKNEFQGRGIGTAILSILAERYTNKMDKIELGVYQSNTGAIRFYEKMGFQITRSLSDLPFYIMQKPLIPQVVP